MTVLSPKNSPQSMIQLVIPHNSWKLFSFLLQECAGEDIKHQTENQFHKILWQSSHTGVKDHIRKIASSITRRIEDLSPHALWLGTIDEKIPRLVSGCGFIIGERVAGILRGYFHCPYIGELSTIDESSLIPFYRIHDSTSHSQTVMVGRENKLEQAKKYCQRGIQLKQFGIIHVTGESGTGKSLFARSLCSDLISQGWKVYTEQYHTDDRGGDFFSKISAKGQDPGIRITSIKKHLRQINQPCIWHIDDGHWMPKSDQDFINNLYNTCDLNCIFIITTRSTQKHYFDLQQGLNLPLSNFTKTETAALIQTISGFPASTRAAEELQQVTEGAPLVTSQVVSGWLDSGLLTNRGGLIDIGNQALRQNSIAELKKVVATQLLEFPEDQAQALCVIAFIRSTIDLDSLETLLEDFGFNLQLHQIPLHHFYRIHQINGIKKLECRHETIRAALLSLLTISKKQCHQVALTYELNKKNWPEAYYHSQFLEHQEIQHKTLLKAYSSAQRLGQLEQVRLLGQAVAAAKLVPKSDQDFHYQMGKTCYLLGEMKESEIWMRRVTSSKRTLPFLGIFSHGIKAIRKNRSLSKTTSGTSYTIDSYQLRADILWNKKHFYQSAGCLIKGWLVSGVMPYPCGARGEAIAGMALITSATPFINIRNRFIRNSLNESLAAQDPQREMRVRLLLAMTMLGTERWQQASKMISPAHVWAKQNNDVKLQLQTGIVLCAIHIFANNLEEGIRLSQEMVEVAKINTDRFLGEFTHCVCSSLTANFQSSAQALRVLVENHQPAQQIPESAALLAALYYSAGDLDESLKQTRLGIDYFCQHPPVSYGMVPLHEYLSLVSLGLWGKDLLEYRYVKKFMQHFKKQAKAFITSRAIYSAWQAVADYCVHQDSLRFNQTLDQAFHEAQQNELVGHQATISTLLLSFGFKSSFQGASKPEEVRRIDQLVCHLKKKIKV